MFGDEIRAGQPETAIFYPPLLSLEGEEKRHSAIGSIFWCKEIQSGQTTHEFRQALEGKTYSAIIGSTNISKLRDVTIDGLVYRIDDGGQVLYDNAYREVQYAKYDKIKKLYYIALK